MGKRATYCHVSAFSPKNALHKFYTEFEGARIGGKSPESKALWINKDEKIIEMPSCKNMVTVDKELKCDISLDDSPSVCHPMDSYGEEEDGSWCPIQDYLNNLSEARYKEKEPLKNRYEILLDSKRDKNLEVIIEDGFKFVRLKNQEIQLSLNF